MDINYILEEIIRFINILSILILLIGVIFSLISFIKSELRKSPTDEKIKSIIFIKNYLGSYILLSLEVLICADIIETIINPSFKDILLLASIVLIRTIISYFLNKEIEASKKEEP